MLSGNNSVLMLCVLHSYVHGYGSTKKNTVKNRTGTQ